MSAFTRIFRAVAMIAALAATGVCRAQVDAVREEISTNDLEDEVIAAVVAQDALDARERPVDLRSASEEMLAGIPGMSAVDARALRRLRDSIGGAAVHEMATAGGAFSSIAPFVTARPANVVVSTRMRAAAQVEPPLGVLDGSYRGSAGSWSMRTDLRWHEWNARIVTDKGAGEAPSADHLIGSVSCDEIIPHVTAIAGDYDLGLAQGLMFWRTLTPGKGSDVVRAPHRAAFGVTAARSPADRASFRGGAAAWSDSVFSLAAFTANVRRDASLGPDGSFTSLTTDSRYRTEADLAKRDAVGEQLVGAHGTMRLGEFTVGATAARTVLDHPWSHGAARVWTLTQAGIDVHATMGPWFLYGECAVDGLRDAAVIAGITGRVTERIDVAASVRAYPRRYLALHVNAFGEHATGENERGVYAAVRWRMNDAVKVSAFHDIFYFPNATGSIPVASSGSESCVTAEIRLSRHAVLRTVVGAKNSPVAVDTMGTGGVPATLVGSSWRGRVHADLRYDRDGIAIGARAACAGSVPRPGIPARTGLVLMADAGFRILRGARVGGRMAWFATQSYDGRVYATEDAPSGTASVPALSGAGERSYLFVTAEPWTGCTVEAKWSTTWTPQAPSIGSGEDQTAGDARHTAEVQISWRFSE